MKKGLKLLGKILLAAFLVLAAAAAGLLFTLVATPVTLFVKYMLERFGPSAE